MDESVVVEKPKIIVVEQVDDGDDAAAAAAADDNMQDVVKIGLALWTSPPPQTSSTFVYETLLERRRWNGPDAEPEEKRRLWQERFTPDCDRWIFGLYRTLMALPESLLPVQLVCNEFESQGRKKCADVLEAYAWKLEHFALNLSARQDVSKVAGLADALSPLVVYGASIEGGRTSGTAFVAYPSLTSDGFEKEIAKCVGAESKSNDVEREKGLAEAALEVARELRQCKEIVVRNGQLTQKCVESVLDKIEWPLEAANVHVQIVWSVLKQLLPSFTKEPSAPPPSTPNLLANECARKYRGPPCLQNNYRLILAQETNIFK